MKYRIDEGPVGFGPGILLGLSEGQVAPRAHRLRVVDDGFEVVEPVQFKTGEVVDILAGDPGKAMLDRMTALDNAGNEVQPRQRRRR